MPRPSPFADPAAVRLLVLDCDGVLTDGSIALDHNGREMKTFNARDGHGLKTWAVAGFHSAVITGRASNALRHRMRELRITHIYQDVGEKLPILNKLADTTGVPFEHMAYCGDDIPDIPVMHAVGYPVAVADAEPPVIHAAAWVTARSGGRGAVRDLTDHLLAAKSMTDHCFVARPDAGHPR